MARLAACAGCGRHIRLSETMCPFCGTSVSGRAFIVAEGPVARPMTRAAILFASATAIAGCGKTTDSMPAPAYGVPVPSDTLVIEAGPPVPPDAGMMTAPAYGVPVPAPEPTPAPPTPNTAGSSGPQKPPPPKKK